MQIRSICICDKSIQTSCRNILPGIGWFESDPWFIRGSKKWGNIYLRYFEWDKETEITLGLWKIMVFKDETIQNSTKIVANDLIFFSLNKKSKKKKFDLTREFFEISKNVWNFVKMVQITLNIKIDRNSKNFQKITFLVIVGILFLIEIAWKSFKMF